VSEEQWTAYWTSVDTATPFLVDERGVPHFHANAYLRKRAKGRLEQFSLSRLAPNSIKAFASDLAYFLNTYQEPSPEVLSLHVTNGDLLYAYAEHLESRDADLRPSTIGRRMLVAREYATYLRDELTTEHSPTNIGALVSGSETLRWSQWI